MIQHIDRVHLVFKTHLDVGFTDLASEVVARYMTVYIPSALALARSLRLAGNPDRFIWTTGSWLIYEYLERAAPPERALMEEAIAADEMVWHALPFTTHSELMDPSLFEFGLSLAGELDRRFGKTTIAAKMTDVPGHTRGIVPLLAAAGVRFLHIGVNPASTAPDVPPVFVWRDSSGAEVIVMYHRGTYGDVMAVPDLTDAIAFAHTDDNRGPQTAEQVADSYRYARAAFPHAVVAASTLDNFAARLLPLCDRLPVITAEIGDTWIHGAGTDPKKVAQFRELCRLRRYWLIDGMHVDEPRMTAFSRSLLMVPEHTWGLDEKQHLDDYTTYDQASLRLARETPRFRRFESSWVEQRAYLSEAVKALGSSAEAAQAHEHLRALEPVRPDLSAYRKIARRSIGLESAHLSLAVDIARGALISLRDRRTGRQWAAPEHPLALLRYETFAQGDYDRFWRQYIINKSAVSGWARLDQTKPGIGAVVSTHTMWLPRLAAAYRRHDEHGQSLLLSLQLPGECSTVYGAPATLCLEVILPHAEPAVYLTLQWFDKPACRLPEALWLSFQPRITRASGWTMEKMGEQISPYEVVRNGNRKLHAVGAGISYADERGQLAIETLDAPLVAPGEPSLLDFNNKRPPLHSGMHVNLYNNVWGTNFPMWYDDDALFRFVLRCR